MAQDALGVGCRAPCATDLLPIGQSAARQRAGAGI